MRQVKIMSETRVKIMNCVIFDEMKMKINKTIQTLEDRCTTMEMLPEMQWLPTMRIKSFGRRESQQLSFEESEDFSWERSNNVTIIKQGKDETIVKSQTGLEWQHLLYSSLFLKSSILGTETSVNLSKTLLQTQLLSPLLKRKHFPRHLFISKGISRMEAPLS